MFTSPTTVGVMGCLRMETPPPKPQEVEMCVDWLLACDFGTSNTTAAELDENGRIRAISLQDLGTSMPSAVTLTPGGFRVGHAALNAQSAHPEGFEPSPKTHIGHEDVLLGDRFVQPEEFVKEVLGVVRATALARHNGVEPRELWLTHPVAWAPSQLDVLRRGAVAAGFREDTVRLVPEPIAAATHYATARDNQPGTRVAVFDFGGGTLDIAVLERAPQEAGGFRVLAYGGDPLLGGRTFDHRLATWALDTARKSGHEQIVERLEHPRDSVDRRARTNFERSVAAAKVELSTHADADISMSVGELEHVVTVTRDEYEALISSDVERGGKLVRDVLDRVDGAPISAIYLTGGSSRTPAIARMLQRVTGIIPATFDDPKLVVSEGALRVKPSGGLRSVQQTQQAAPMPAFGVTAGVEGPTRPEGSRQELRPAGQPAAGLPGSGTPGNQTSRQPMSGAPFAPGSAQARREESPFAAAPYAPEGATAAYPVPRGSAPAGSATPPQRFAAAPSAPAPGALSGPGAPAAQSAPTAPAAWAQAPGVGAPAAGFPETPKKRGIGCWVIAAILLVIAVIIYILFETLGVAFLRSNGYSVWGVVQPMLSGVPHAGALPLPGA